MTDAEFNAERIWRICLSCAREIYGTTPPSHGYALATAKLLFGTAAQESGLQYERQRIAHPEGDIGGFSKWQVEKGSIDASLDWVAKHSELGARGHEWLFAGTKAAPVLRFGNTGIIMWAMRLDDNDKIGCLFARLHYMRVREPIPDTLRGQAEYWKEHYNTEAGKGTVDQYIAAWAILCQPTIVRSHVE